MAKKGSEKEQVVALLESRINPNAKIETNIHLPDLANPGHKRECDVVIYEEINKRIITTIVEVQDRRSKVSIGEYTNFYQKFRDVGANRLIIVSKKEFPLSVIDKAKIHGPAVQLINLNKLDAQAFEVGSIIYFYDLYEGKLNATFSKDGVVLSDEQKKEITERINSKEKVLIYKDEFINYIELFDLCKDNYTNLVVGIQDFEFVIRAHDGLSIKIDDGTFPLAIIFNGQMIVKREFVTDLAEYKPIDVINPLIYVSEAIISINGKNEKIVLTYEWNEQLQAYSLKPEPTKGLKLQRIGITKRESVL